MTASAAVDTNPAAKPQGTVNSQEAPTPPCEGIGACEALGSAMVELVRKAGIKVMTDSAQMRLAYENSLPIAVVRQYSKELPPRDIGLDPASYAAKLQKISERLNAIAEKRAKRVGK